MSLSGRLGGVRVVDEADLGPSYSVAMMELLIFMSTLIYRYDFKLVDTSREELDVVEGFLRKVSLDSLRRRCVRTHRHRSTAARMSNGCPAPSFELVGEMYAL